MQTDDESWTTPYTVTLFDNTRVHGVGIRIADED